MTAGVYAIINTATGMAYIGSSRQIELRWSGWRSKLERGAGGSKALQADWNETQGQGFSFTVLEETESQDDALEQAERRWIAQYDGRCYNIHKQAGRPSIGSALTRLADVRRAAGLSVVKLARKAGVSTGVIYNAERGRMTYGSTAGSLADALGVHWYKLISAEEEQRLIESHASWIRRCERRSARIEALIATKHRPRRRRPRATPEAYE